MLLLLLLHVVEVVRRHVGLLLYGEDGAVVAHQASQHGLESVLQRRVLEGFDASMHISDLRLYFEKRTAIYLQRHPGPAASPAAPSAPSSPAAAVLKERRGVELK